MIQLSASRLSLGPARPTNLRDGVGSVSVATRELACAFALRPSSSAVRARHCTRRSGLEPSIGGGAAAATRHCEKAEE